MSKLYNNPQTLVECPELGLPPEGCFSTDCFPTGAEGGREERGTCFVPELVLDAAGLEREDEAADEEASLELEEEASLEVEVESLEEAASREEEVVEEDVLARLFVLRGTELWKGKYQGRRL